MSRIPFARRIVVLLLSLAVAAPLAAAPIHRSDSVRFEAAAPLASLWTWLSHVWAKNGCMIDPGGRCLPGTGAAPAGADNGCGLDPGGRCLPGTGAAPAGADNGCGIDPHGACQPAASPVPSADNGCAIDPWGRCGS